jgi:hypothetical protein
MAAWRSSCCVHVLSSVMQMSACRSAHARPSDARQFSGSRTTVTHIEQRPVLTVTTERPHGSRLRGINERLDRAGIHQRTVQPQYAAEGDKIILEPEFVRSFEPDPVNDPNEVPGHVAEGDRLGDVRRGGHERVRAAGIAEDAATLTEALDRLPSAVARLPHNDVEGIAQQERRGWR